MHLCYCSFSCVSFLQTSFSKQFHPVEHLSVARGKILFSSNEKSGQRVLHPVLTVKHLCGK